MRGQGRIRMGWMVRRGIALGLAVSALWVTARTVGLSDSAQALETLARDAQTAAALLRLQLPAAPESDAPELWQRLLTIQSPLLRLAWEDGRDELGDEPDEVGPADGEEDDGEERDEPEPAVESVPDGKVVSRTMAPSAAQSYLRAGDIYIANRAKKQADAAALAAAPVQITLSDGPQILILHTHGTEAYTPADGDTYVPSDPYRTTDCSRNVVRVGEEMAQVFRDHGFQVVHDTGLYDYPSYNGAYGRSGAAAERWLAQYPTIQVILDVHRDALEGEDGTVYKAVSAPADGGTAQVMLVVGTDGTGSKHPLWRENLTFAMHLQRRLLDDHGTLARPIVLRASGFNQQLSVGSLLVEVGTHGNTLREAVAGARLFAESACAVLDELK